MPSAWKALPGEADTTPWDIATLNDGPSVATRFHEPDGAWLGVCRRGSQAILMGSAASMNGSLQGGSGPTTRREPRWPR